MAVTAGPDARRAMESAWAQASSAEPLVVEGLAAMQAALLDRRRGGRPPEIRGVLIEWPRGAADGATVFDALDWLHRASPRTPVVVSASARDIPRVATACDARGAELLAGASPVPQLDLALIRRRRGRDVPVLWADGGEPDVLRTCDEHVFVLGDLRPPR